MKKFTFLIPAVLSLIVLTPATIHACPVGWEYVYEQGVPSAGFSFTHQETHNVGVGAVYDEGMFFRHLLVVDISVWDVWPNDTIWTRVYEGILGEGRSIIKVPDGYVIAGRFPEYSDSGGPHVLMVKIDENGELIWQNDETQGIGNSVTATPDGGYLVTGRGRYPDFDLLVARYDAEGDTLWTRVHGSENYDEGYSVSPVSDGNYVITGTKMSSDYTGQDGRIWWLKIDGDGEIIWEHDFGAENFDYWGTSIAELDDGGFIIGGGDGEQGVEVAKNLVVIKADSSGETEWMKEHYACLYFADPTPYWVDKTSDGGYIAAGMGFDFMKLEGSGEIEWKSDIATKYLSTLSCCVRQTSDERFVAVGVAEDMFYLIDANENGFIQIPGVNETPSVLDNPLSIEVLNTVGTQIELLFDNPSPASLLILSVFDASGRKVDEIRTVQSSGVITWGEGHSPGVYFIRQASSPAHTQKVVIVK